MWCKVPFALRRDLGTDSDSLSEVMERNLDRLIERSYPMTEASDELRARVRESIAERVRRI